MGFTIEVFRLKQSPGGFLYNLKISQMIKMWRFQSYEGQQCTRTDCRGGLKEILLPQTILNFRLVLVHFMPQTLEGTIVQQFVFVTRSYQQCWARFLKRCQLLQIHIYSASRNYTTENVCRRHKTGLPKKLAPLGVLELQFPEFSGACWLRITQDLGKMELKLYC